MTSPLQGSIAKQVGAALKPFMYPLTIRQTIAGEYDPDTGTSADIIVDHPCRGYVSEYDWRIEAANLVAPNDRKVMVLSTTLATTPTTNDQVVIEGEAFAIKRISRDPAGATWELQARR